MFGRSFYLGEPMTIPMRRLESGGLLLFTFFMISDPRTTPDHPIARVLFGALVAYVAWYIQFRLFRTNGVIWSLALCAPLVPVLDRVLPGRRFAWTDAAVLPLAAAHSVPCHRIGKDPRVMKRPLSLLFGLAALVAAAPAPADAFCGFFVAKADTKLFNKASKVVLARDGDRTVMTMSNDFKGEPEGVRGRRAGADLPAEGADPRRRAVADRPPRRLHGAAAGRVLRREPVRSPALR